MNTRMYIYIYIHYDVLYQKNGNFDTGFAATAFNVIVASSANSQNIGSDSSSTSCKDLH